MQATPSAARASSVAIAVVSVYLGGWGIYYAIQDTARRAAIRSRRRRHPLQPRPKGIGPTRARSASASSTSSASSSSSSPSLTSEEQWQQVYATSSSEELPSARIVERASPLNADSRRQWYGAASDMEHQSIRSRFAPLSILGRYCNPFPEWREVGAWEFLYWKLLYTPLRYPSRLNWDGGLADDLKSERGKTKVQSTLPVNTLDREKLWGHPEDVSESVLEHTPPCAKAEGTTFTWIGQSTCLVQMSGVNILTDPVFSPQPVKSIFSPTRMRPPPCQIEDLVGVRGRIDIVLLSHNHFDHIDVSMIPKLSPDTCWVVPSGVRSLLEAHGVSSEMITELEWWEQSSADVETPARDASGFISHVRRKATVHAVPAMHWTGRDLLGVNRSLWNSYVIRVGTCLGSEDQTLREASFFFCCDSGYSPLMFSSIGRALGPVDVAAVPIGSYLPLWHMSMQHCSPKDAVQMALDVGARQAFGTHWGTWSMSDEHWDQPPEDLKKALDEQRLSRSYFRTLPFGETVDVVNHGSKR